MALQILNQIQQYKNLNIRPSFAEKKYLSQRNVKEIVDLIQLREPNKDNVDQILRSIVSVVPKTVTARCRQKAYKILMVSNDTLQVKAALVSTGAQIIAEKVQDPNSIENKEVVEKLDEAIDELTVKIEETVDTATIADDVVVAIEEVLDDVTKNVPEEPESLNVADLNTVINVIDDVVDDYGIDPSLNNKVPVVSIPAEITEENVEESIEDIVPESEKLTDIIQNNVSSYNGNLLTKDDIIGLMDEYTKKYEDSLSSKFAEFRENTTVANSSDKTIELVDMINQKIRKLDNMLDEMSRNFIKKPEELKKKENLGEDNNNDTIKVQVIDPVVQTPVVTVPMRLPARPQIKYNTMR